MTKKNIPSKSRKPSQAQDNNQLSSKKTKKTQNKKNLSLPEPIQKIVDVVAEPLKKIARRTHKNDEVDVPFAENSSTDLTTSLRFFYSNDRFIDTFDDKHIYEQICKDYPALDAGQKNPQHKRSAIVDILNDEEYMQMLKDEYGMSPFDVISFMFRLCPSLFKGIFIKKIQNIVKRKKYAKAIKKPKYKVAGRCKSVCKQRSRSRKASSRRNSYRW